MINFFTYYLCFTLSALSFNALAETPSTTSPKKTNEQSLPIKYELALDFIKPVNKSKNISTEEQEKDKEKELTTLLWQVSDAKRLIDKPITSILIVKSRLTNDIELFKKALNSRGFYDAKIDYDVNLETYPIQVKFHVRLGSEYKVDQLNLKLVNHKTEKPQDLNQFALKRLWAKERELLTDIQSKLYTKAADSRKILIFEAALLQNLKNFSFADSQLIKKSYWLDRTKKVLNINYLFDLGKEIHLNEVVLTGLKTVNQAYVKKKLAWKKEDKYTPEKLDKTFQNLLSTNLFSKVQVKLAKKKSQNNNKEMKLVQNEDWQYRPVLIDFKEASHKTIKASLGFDTDTGASIGSSWEHRNLFGAAENLKVSAAWKGTGPVLETHYSQDTFFKYPFNFIADVKYQSEETDAYNSQTFLSTAGLEKKYKKDMSASAGIGFRLSKIEAIDLTQTSVVDEENYALLYFPLSFKWDKTNDLFEPSQGGKALVQLIPYQSLNSTLRFTHFSLSYSHYYSILNSTVDKNLTNKERKAFIKDKLVLAGRIKLAKVLGCVDANIPADLRLYSGGGGSIRGFASQLAGPLSSANIPLGGCSSFDFSSEVRFKISKKSGVVAFVDGGSSFSETLFDSSSELLLGAGLGYRYSSPIGPLRADLAIPVNPRDGIDAKYQLYLSIGHAF